MDDKLKQNQFQWNGITYSISNLEPQDSKTLKDQKLTSIVFGKVMDSNSVFKSWIYSIKEPSPPILIANIESFYIKLFPYSKKDGIGMDRIELTRTQFLKEINAIRNYEERKPVNDSEKVQESIEKASRKAFKTSLEAYLEETSKIRPVPSKRSFRSYFLEDARGGR